MAWRRPGDKPLSEPMLVNLPTQICVTRPQWVNKMGSETITIIHYNDVIISSMAYQITAVLIVCSGVDQRKHQSSASLVFVRGVHKGLVTWKMFSFNDTIMSNDNRYAIAASEQWTNIGSKFLLQHDGAKNNYLSRPLSNIACFDNGNVTSVVWSIICVTPLWKRSSTVIADGLAPNVHRISATILVKYVGRHTPVYRGHRPPCVYPVYTLTRYLVVLFHWLLLSREISKSTSQLWMDK